MVCVCKWGSIWIPQVLEVTRSGGHVCVSLGFLG